MDEMSARIVSPVLHRGVENVATEIDLVLGIAAEETGDDSGNGFGNAHVDSLRIQDERTRETALRACINRKAKSQAIAVSAVHAAELVRPVPALAGHVECCWAGR